MDLDLTPVERVARMLGEGYLYGSHFLQYVFDRFGKFPGTGPRWW